MGDGTVINGFWTSIADIRSLIKTVTLFFNEIRTGLVTGWTGSTLDVTEYDLSTCICFLTVIPMNTKVVCIIKGAFMVPVTQPMKLYLLGNGSRILA